jgi:hypothetical protein
MVWVALVTGGCLVASLLALSLRPLLSPVQDGRAAVIEAIDEPEPAHASPAGS